MNDPLVSVVLPTYNLARHVGEAIESVLAQTYSRYELLVVDDGSTDNTKEVVGKYLSDRRVTYIHKENGGCSSAYNRGLSEARGGYIAFLEHDDMWMPEKLQLQVQVLEDNPEFGMVHSDVSVINEQGVITRKSGNRERQSHNGMVFEEFFMSDVVIAPLSTVLVRTECLAKTGKFDEELPWDDYGFLLRLAWRYPIYFIPQSLIKYRLTPGSLSHKHADQRVACYEETIRRFAAAHTDLFEKHKELLKTKWLQFHRYSGSVLFQNGFFSLSHSHFRKALRSDPATWLMYLLTFAPEGMLVRLQKVKRTFRTRR